MNGETGELMWSFKPDGLVEVIAAAGGLDEDLGLIFVGTLDKIFYAVNITNG